MEHHTITEYIVNCRQIRLSTSEILSSPDFHLIAVLEGNSSCTQDSRTFHASCYQLFGIPSARFTAEHCIAFHLILKPEFLLDYLDNTFFFTRDSVILPKETESRLHRLLCRYAALEADADASRLFLKASVLYELLDLLAEQSPSSTPISSNLPLYQKITAYMNVNYSRPIGLSDTAKHFHITPQYLSRIMNLHAGSTFRNCLDELRRKKAEAYLTYTRLSSADICERTGLTADSDVFSAASHMSNLAFPQKHAFGEEIPILPQDFAAYFDTVPFSITNHPCPDTMKEREITFDMDSGRSLFCHSFFKLINLGYASQLKTQGIEPLLKALLNKIPFTYGRICRITDLISQNIAGNKKLYDYTSVFSLLDIVIENRMLPFLELGNKTLLIQVTAAEHDSHALQAPTDSVPYYDSLLELLPEFLQACLNRYGQECFDQWKFEISYTFTEPNEIESFRFPHFVEYFQKIYRIIRYYSPCCQIGGPGFNDWGSTSVLRYYLEAFSQQKHIPDFLTAYLYPMEKVGRGRYVISSDADIIKKRLKIFQTETAVLYPNRDIWITEFNSNLSSRSHLNDLSYQASFLAKTFLNTLNAGIKAIGYYLLSDAPLRYSDSLDFLFGGWGLYTDTLIPKPSCHAFEMFSLLGNYLVKQDDDYILTKDSNGSFQLLVNHYAHPVQKYLDENIKLEDIKKPGLDMFAFPEDACFSFIFTHIPPGNYLVKEYRISSTSCCLFHQWENMGFLTPAREQELNDLRRLSLLTPGLSVCPVRENEPLDIRCCLTEPQLRLYLIEQYS